MVLGMEHMDLIEKVSKMCEEERLVIIYKLMESLNIELYKTIETIDGSKVAPSLISDTLTLMRDFEMILRQLYQLENKLSIKEDIENSTSLILR